MSVLRILMLALIPQVVRATEGALLVEDSQPRAQIVLAEQRTRMATLAALELQHYIEKIGGARLSIVTEPTEDDPIHIHVGSSPSTLHG